MWPFYHQLEDSRGSPRVPKSLHLIILFKSGLSHRTIFSLPRNFNKTTIKVSRGFHSGRCIWQTFTPSWCKHKGICVLSKEVIYSHMKKIFNGIFLKHSVTFSLIKCTAKKNPRLDLKSCSDSSFFLFQSFFSFRWVQPGSVHIKVKLFQIPQRESKHRLSQ